MTLHRKAYEELKEWKNSTPSSKAILIKGARRVGKSFLAENFAKNEYKSYILIDFASPKNGTLKIFERFGNKESLNDFFNQLSVLYGVPLHERQSVFIFDEIQKYPKARELIKYLVADGRYDYIETGSLISIKKNVKNIVIPSEEEPFELHPLDFEEFLLALSDTVTIPFLKNAFENKKPLGNMLKPIMDKFRNYMIIGGMPKAVAEYVESGNIDKVEKVKQGIINLYREDIAKYAEGYVAEATAIFNSIPALLAHHDKKIKYSSLGEGDRFSSYKDAIHWIADSMVGNLCVGTDEPDVFTGFTIQPSKLKCYMEDTGILLSLAAGENYLTSELYKSFALGKTSANKGMMTENIIAQTLAANKHPLRFYEKIVESGGKKTKYEVDFLIKDGDKVVPVEVKSGNCNEHHSLDFYQSKFKSATKKGIVLTKGDLRETENYLYLPLFMAMFL